MTAISLIILVIAGLGVATAYVVAGPKLRNLLHHRAERVKPSA